MKAITVDDLEKWTMQDPEQFTSDVQTLATMYQERYKKYANMRQKYTDARDEVTVLRDQLDSNEERMAEAKATAIRNMKLMDRFLDEEPLRAAVPREDTPASHQTTGGGSRVAKLPDPPLFSGEDRTLFDDWLVQIKNKLRGNEDFYPTEVLKIIYVSSRLSSGALALVTPRLDEDSEYAYHKVTELYTHLKELYSDPNKANNARREFHNLRMKATQAFQEFYAKFIRLVTESGMSQQDLKFELNEKLTWELQAAVAIYFNDDSVTSTVFVQRCTTIDQQIRARSDSKKRAERFKATAKTPPATPGYASTSPPISKPVLSGTYRAPINISADTARPRSTGTPKPNGIIDPTTVKCFNCNKIGHFATSCQEPHTQRTRAAITRMEEGLHSETESTGTTGNSDAEVESGNEDS
jgi:hypothetical protein